MERSDWLSQTSVGGVKGSVQTKKVSEVTRTSAAPFKRSIFTSLCGVSDISFITVLFLLQLFGFSERLKGEGLQSPVISCLESRLELGLNVNKKYSKTNKCVGLIQNS